MMQGIAKFLDDNDLTLYVRRNNNGDGYTVQVIHGGVFHIGFGEKLSEAWAKAVQFKTGCCVVQDRVDDITKFLDDNDLTLYVRRNNKGYVVILTHGGVFHTGFDEQLSEAWAKAVQLLGESWAKNLHEA